MKQIRSDDLAPVLRRDIRPILDRLDSHGAILTAHTEEFRLMHANLDRLNVAVAKLSGNMVEVKSELRSLGELKIEFARFHTYLDSLVARQEAFMQKWFSHDSMLMEHERRTGLES